MCVYRTVRYIPKKPKAGMVVELHDNMCCEFYVEDNKLCYLLYYSRKPQSIKVSVRLPIDKYNIISVTESHQLKFITFRSYESVLHTLLVTKSIYLKTVAYMNVYTIILFLYKTRRIKLPYEIVCFIMEFLSPLI